jgi:hypothetical protein
MQILNVEQIENKVWFGGIVSRWLRDDLKIDSIAEYNKGFYFVVNDELREIISNAPFFIKSVIRIEGNWKNWEGGENA